MGSTTQPAAAQRTLLTSTTARQAVQCCSPHLHTARELCLCNMHLHAQHSLCGWAQRHSQCPILPLNPLLPPGVLQPKARQSPTDTGAPTIPDKRTPLPGVAAWPQELTARRLAHPHPQEHIPAANCSQHALSAPQVHREHQNASHTSTGRHVCTLQSACEVAAGLSCHSCMFQQQYTGSNLAQCAWWVVTLLLQTAAGLCCCTHCVAHHLLPCCSSC